MNNNLINKVNANADRIQQQRERQYKAQMRKQIAHDDKMQGYFNFAVFCGAFILCCTICAIASMVLNVPFN